MMMNATPQIPQQATPSEPAQSTTPLFSRAEAAAKGRDFARLFHDATKRDAAQLRPGEDPELVGPAMNWNQSVDMATTELAEKPKVAVSEGREEPAQTREETVARERQPTAKEEPQKTEAKPAASDKAVTADKKPEAKAEDLKNEPKGAKPAAQAKPEGPEVKVVKSVASTGEPADAKLMDLMETVEGEVELPEQVELPVEMEAELSPEAELEPEEVLEAEELNSIQKSRQSATEAKKVRSAQNQSVSEGKVENSEKPPPNGTNSAPRNPNMFAEVKTSQATEPKPGGAVSVDTNAQASAEDASGQGAGSNLSREHETPPQALNPQAVAATGQASGATQVFAQPSVQVSAVLEAIWARVTQFRARGDSQWSVQIRPDDHTRMELTIKVSAAGVEIQTRMQQGDMGRLMSSWGELQQALTERGVNLKDLEADKDFRDNLAGDSNAAGQDRNPASANADERDAEGEFGLNNWQPDGGAEEEPAPPAARTTHTHDGWESWA